MRSYYCAGAIRGDTSYLTYVKEIMKVVALYGEAHSERSGSLQSLYNYDDTGDLALKKIYERDMRWLRDSRAVIAEISGASTGTGFEIGEAIAQRKPVMCLHHESSRPSLIITQCPSAYLIVQRYHDEIDLNAFLSCFMEIVSRADSEESTEVSRMYKLMVNKVDPRRFTKDEAERIAIGLIDTLHEVKQRTDFNEPKRLLDFMIRNLVLLTRWDRLTSQRIGDTYLNGSLPRMIKFLASLSIENQLIDALNESTPGVMDLARDYGNHRSQRAGYESKAFVKNLKAFVRIGLLVYPKGRVVTTESDLDEIDVVSTLEGNETVISRKSRVGPLSKPAVAVTRHLQELAAFLERYDHRPLISLLKEFRERKEWYEIMAKLPERNVDEINGNRASIDRGMKRYLTLRFKDIKRTKSVGLI